PFDVRSRALMPIRRSIMPAKKTQPAAALEEAPSATESLHSRLTEFIDTVRELARAIHSSYLEVV
ncbi:hypothetical protein, partial [Pseudomonas sp. AGC67]